MRNLLRLFENNREWAETIIKRQPDFFAKLEAKQSPEFLWIGCSDSRVPANEIVGLLPGELFVHRNVANVVVHSDLNCLSVLQYAVDVLRVGHIIVCGHYGCGGVRAALEEVKLGLIDNWLLHVKDVRRKHRAEIDPLSNRSLCERRLCELNVVEQALHVCETTIVEDAWERQQELSVHGWIYDLKDGILKDLGFCVNGPGEVKSVYETAKRPIS